MEGHRRRGTGTPVTGSVDLITSPDFIDNSAPFTGAANVVAYPSAGGTFTAPYAGGGRFASRRLPNGPAWFFVQAPNTNAWSTLSPTTLPAAQLVLPVIDQVMLQNIASPPPEPLRLRRLDRSRRQIVLLISDAGGPCPGVSATGNTGGAVRVYDTGNGVYSDSATATGIAGTIILLNSGLQGTQVITLTDTTMTSQQVIVMAQAGAVTLVRVAWQ